MNLLLLLSALLSALTGASVGGGRLHAVPAVAERTIGQAATKVTVMITTARPVQALPHLRASADMELVAWPALPAPQFWANRRRE